MESTANMLVDPIINIPLVHGRVLYTGMYQVSTIYDVAESTKQS